MPHVLLSPQPRLEESVADILKRAPARFALVGTSYGGNLAMEVALAAPERVTALWLMGCCNPAAPPADGPDLAGGLENAPVAVFDTLARLVVHEDAVPEAACWHCAGARAQRAAGGRVQARRLDDDGPGAVGQALASALPNALFEVL